MSLLPSNGTVLERALEKACDLGIDPDVIRGVADSARCPPNFLPWLGWAMKVEGWEAANTDEQRRELIREAIPVHKTKGTVGAIRRVLKAVRVNAEFKEWHQIPNAAPYTFQVTAWANDNREGEGSVLSPQLGERLRALIDAAKNERSHYEFRLGARFEGSLAVAAAARARAVYRRAAEILPIPADTASSGLLVAAAAKARCVVRRAAAITSIPINSESGLVAACAARARVVVRGSMEGIVNE
ncbi:phage tail protein I [Pseudomonas asiatica]|uniref:phage tail protein I n=1 Tax=Pseudomonas asiatica TaxID=2219225 RepID=UPI00244AA48A|nr:phage tail protein I [Pseudomonas asiatica]MDH0133533.1 phage tail protein I [Pseudomonas asiatica]